MPELNWFEAVLERSDADCVLLACTELPIVVNKSQYNGVRIADGNTIYIDELIKMGGAKVKDE
jgi:aspartate/glutamate racemase